MTLKEYLIENLINRYQLITEGDKSSFDYNSIKIDLQGMLGPARSFFEDNQIDEFFDPGKFSKNESASGFERFPWTEYGWKVFMGENEDGKGGIFNSKLGASNEIKNYFLPFLTNNGLDTDIIHSPEAKKESSDDEKKKDEEDSEEKPKGEGKELKDLDEQTQGKIALKMLDGKSVKVAKKKDEESGEEKVLFYLDDEIDLDEEGIKRVNNRLIFAIMCKYFASIKKKINDSPFKKDIQNIVKNIENINSIAPLYILFLAMTIKYNLENNGDFTPFSEGDIANTFVGEEVDDTIIRDFCIISLSVCTMLNAGLNEEEITQLINFTGLLNEDA